LLTKNNCGSTFACFLCGVLFNHCGVESWSGKDFFGFWCRGGVCVFGVGVWLWCWYVVFVLVSFLGVKGVFYYFFL